MKIKLSKNQWKMIGKTAGWMKTSQEYNRQHMLKNKPSGKNKFEFVDISMIMVGDLVEHDNTIRTVGKKDMHRLPDGEKTLFGDSYNLGYKKVKRVLLPYIE
jgi:hypothetical protein